MASDGGVSETALEMWTVYDSPLDYPGKFVARLWVIRRGDPEPRPTGDLAIASTLEAVREMLPFGLTLLPRSEEDEPQIVESWI